MRRLKLPWENDRVRAFLSIVGWLSWEWGHLLWQLLKQVDENGHYYAHDKIRASDQTKSHLGKHF